MSELKQILHVEDDRSIQAVVRVSLEAIGGYQVQSCSSGHQALEEVQAFAPQFVLLDVMMPGMGGPETLARLSERTDLQQTPVVLLTGQPDDPADPEELQRLGVCKLLTKPFDPLQLAARLNEIWNAEHE